MKKGQHIHKRAGGTLAALAQVYGGDSVEELDEEPNQPVASQDSVTTRA